MNAHTNPSFRNRSGGYGRGVSTKTISLAGHGLLAGGLSFYLAHLLIIKLLVGWVIAVNLVLFLSFGLDKLFAQAGLRRTPEITFLVLACLGAFPALLSGRKLFRHKTIKAEFVQPMWGLFILQIGLVVWYLIKA